MKLKSNRVGTESDFRFTMNFPIERGVITNWDEMETIWYHAFLEEMRLLPEEQPVLLTEPVNNRKVDRERMTQIMFETFQVPSLYLGCQPVLSLYTSGRTTGVVWDSGDISQIMAIYEGFQNPQAVMKLNFGGCDITNYLRDMLKRSGYNHNFIAGEVCSVKEKLAYVALDYDAEKSRNMAECNGSYVREVGDVITINEERFMCPELLFAPHLNGLGFEGIHKTIVKVINSYDMTLRKDLFANLVISGGNTMFSGLPERLSKEMTALAPPTAKVNVVAPEDRGYGVWKGGCLFASLPTFSQMCISAAEYKENGPGFVHCKFP